MGYPPAALSYDHEQRALLAEAKRLTHEIEAAMEAREDVVLAAWRAGVTLGDLGRAIRGGGNGPTYANIAARLRDRASARARLQQNGGSA